MGEPLLLEMRFSEAVSGLTLADFRVRNATLSDVLPCSCRRSPVSRREPGAPASDAIWGIEVTPTAVGEVEVELLAGVYEDAHGNTGTASPVYRKAARKPAVTITAVAAEIDEGQTAQFTLSKDIGVGSMTVTVEVTDTLREPTRAR